MTKLSPRPTPTAQPTAPPLPKIDPITHLPILILYPHSRCNCRCLMCDIWRTTTRDELEPEAVAEWLASWRELGLKRVVLSGGEALMHSRLWELCAVLRAANIGISLLSTGLLLKRHAAELVRWCDDIVVSLDGPEPIHDAIRRVPRAFARLSDGVAAVKRADAHVAVTGRCTVQRSNFRHLRATVRAAADIGLDRISFLAADVNSSAFNRPDGWDDAHTAEVALGIDDLPDLAAELTALEREHADDFVNGFIAESPIKLHRRIYQHFAASHGMAHFHPNTCNAPWVSSVIESDGTVRPCFFQPAYGNLHRVGEAAKAEHGSALLALLNAPEAVAWRRQLDTSRDEICKRCVCTLTLRGETA